MALIIIIIVFVGLRIYTRHSQKVSVPSVEGMTIEQAQKIIRERNLEPVVSDSVYGGNAKPGTIIPEGQIPVAGFQVKEGRKVFLIYKAWSKEPVKMPAVEGISLNDAKMQLVQAGLLPGKITKQKGRYKDLVLEARFNGAKISQGKSLSKGDIIDLVISEGEEEEEEEEETETTVPLSDGIDEEF